MINNYLIFKIHYLLNVQAVLCGHLFVIPPSSTHSYVCVYCMIIRFKIYSNTKYDNNLIKKPIRKSTSNLKSTVEGDNGQVPWYV